MATSFPLNHALTTPDDLEAAAKAGDNLVEFVGQKLSYINANTSVAGQITFGWKEF